jgi:Family of unknown function (DUF6958)
MKNRKATPRRSARQTSTREAVPMVTVQNVNVPGYASRVNLAKYTAMRRALLRVLPSRAPGMTQAEMFVAVKGHLPEHLFPGGGKANWWAKTVQLDLEKKGIVRRSADMKPLRWYGIKA